MSGGVDSSLAAALLVEQGFDVTGLFMRVGADAADHAFTGFYGPPPLLTVVETLEEYGHHAVGLNKQPVIDTSNRLRPEREFYRDFESQFLGFDPSVQIHKLPGGATGSSFEQAVRGGFLHLMPRILQDELPHVQVELGNWWSVTPGSQILWTTAVNNTLKGARYKDVSDDLKNLAGILSLSRANDYRQVVHCRAWLGHWSRGHPEDQG